MNEYIGFLIAGEVILFALVLSLNRIVNRWVDCQKAHTVDKEIPITAELVRTWRKALKQHDPKTDTYKAYKANLLRAGIDIDGD